MEEKFSSFFTYHRKVNLYLPIPIPIVIGIIGTIGRAAQEGKKRIR
jgi:hypothetical protein